VCAGKPQLTRNQKTQTLQQQSKPPGSGAYAHLHALPGHRDSGADRRLHDLMQRGGGGAVGGADHLCGVLPAQLRVCTGLPDLQGHGAE